MLTANKAQHGHVAGQSDQLSHRHKVSQSTTELELRLLPQGPSPIDFSHDMERLAPPKPLQPDQEQQ